MRNPRCLDGRECVLDGSLRTARVLMTRRVATARVVAVLESSAGPASLFSVPSGVR